MLCTIEEIARYGKDPPLPLPEDAKEVRSFRKKAVNVELNDGRLNTYRKCGDVLKFIDDDQVLIGECMTSESAQVRNLNNSYPFAASDYARQLNKLVEPRFAESIRQLRNMRSREELYEGTDNS